MGGRPDDHLPRALNTASNPGLAERVVNLVAAHPAVRDVRLVGSRAEGHAGEHSDWDFLVETHDFAAAAEALHVLLAPLAPLAQQWDRLSTEWCWMLILRGPTKVDLIFPDEAHTDEPPWEPNASNLADIEAHFWDWTLWLRSKEAGGKAELIETELDKLFAHLLAPLGVSVRPRTLVEAVAGYRRARTRAERALGVAVSRELEAAVAPMFGPGS